MHRDDEFPLDALSQLQLRVARRADQLALEIKIPTPMNLHCWLMAESELIERPCEPDAKKRGRPIWTSNPAL
jgi:hypothetical protein